MAISGLSEERLSIDSSQPIKELPGDSRESAIHVIAISPESVYPET